jgi:hypothetical protein
MLLLLLQVEELQDQLAKAVKHNKGAGSEQLLLDQLSAIQAAYAELKEEAVSNRLA